MMQCIIHARMFVCHHRKRETLLLVLHLNLLIFVPKLRKKSLISELWCRVYQQKQSQFLLKVTMGKQSQYVRE